MTVPYPAPPAEPYLANVGDIGVTAHWVVTPHGTVPLAGSEWWLAERGGWTRHIPIWAIVLAVVFFPLGLLFLLCKEQRWTSWLEVTVRSGAFVHATTLAVPSHEAANAPAAVDYVRGLAAAAVAQ